MGNIQSLPDDGQWSSKISMEVMEKYLRPTTEYSLKILRQYFERYRLFVKHNPLLVSEIESALYWISYLLATTRFHNSRIISELLSSCSSLLTLFDDSLLRRSYGLSSTNQQNTKSTIYAFHLILQFIEYVQVFVELTAVQLYGRYGKWLVISIIEIIKASIRLLLLFYYQQGLTRRQYLMPLNRLHEFERFQMKHKFQPQQQQQTDSSSPRSSVDEAIVIPDDDDEVIIPDDDNIVHHNNLEPDETQLFRLKSSGRIIRNIGQAPPKEKRTWLTPQQQQRLRRLFQKNHRSSPTVTQLNQRRLIGELLHILRPVIHLTTGAIVGGVEDHWTPYMVSLGLDVISLRLLQGSNFYSSNDKNLFGLINCNDDKDNGVDMDVDHIWNWSERLEIQRRYLSLLMYLLRSPFYDQYTKQRLLRLISLFANYIPLFGRLCRPLIRVLPEWQQIYFYVWN